MIKIGGQIYKLRIEHKAIKNIYLRIISGNTLFVTCPYEVDDASVIAFIREKEKWIVKHGKTSQMEFITNDHIMFWGKTCHLELYKGNDKVTIAADRVTIGCQDADLNRARQLFYQKTNKLIIELVKQYERLWLPKLKDYGYAMIPEYKIKPMKSRWGVCYTRKNQIILNSYLIHFPPICLESVYWHELLHFVIPNHSKRFNEVLRYHMPDYDKAQKLLSKGAANV